MGIGGRLFTSGLGGGFPPGYPGARITELRDDPGSPFATVIAEPTARLDRSHEVLLVWTLDAPASAATASEPEPAAPDQSAARGGRVAEAAGTR